MLKRVLLIILGIAGLGVGGLVVWGLVKNEPLPEGKSGPEADALAQRMMASIDTLAWDSTRIIQWTFMDQHSFIWDRERHQTEVSWGNKRVLLDINSKKGLAYVDQEQITGEDALKLVESAYSYWVNDAFWMNPVTKAFDPGTSRSLVELENGQEALLIQYQSGGLTPGDAYLWILDENDRPTAWRLWVSVLPVGGLELSWEGWQQMETGVWISTLHVGDGGAAVTVSDVKTYSSLESWLNGNPDPFAAL